MKGLEIEVTDNNYPIAFTWRGKRFTVSRFGGHWRLAGHWWEGQGVRYFLRVITNQGPVADLSFEPQTGQWALKQVHG